jgi:hypothetical protein
MQSRDNAAPSPWSIAGDQAGALLREHREQLLRYAELPAMPDVASQAVAEPPALSLDVLPEAIQRLARDYEHGRPGVRLEPRQYLTVGDAPVSRGAGGMPEADDLVTITVTETIATSDEIRVLSHVLVAARVTDG